MAFCYYSYSDFIVVTALIGKTSSLHTLCSCRLTRLRGRPIFATAFVYNLAKVVSQGEFNMPRNHILWSSAHIKAILMKIIFYSEKSGPGKTGLAGLVATALRDSSEVIINRKLK